MTRSETKVWWSGYVHGVLLGVGISTGVWVLLTKWPW